MRIFSRRVGECKSAGPSLRRDVVASELVVAYEGRFTEGRRRSECEGTDRLAPGRTPESAGRADGAEAKPACTAKPAPRSSARDCPGPVVADAIARLRPIMILKYRRACM